MNRWLLLLFVVLHLCSCTSTTPISPRITSPESPEIVAAGLCHYFRESSARTRHASRPVIVLTIDNGEDAKTAVALVSDQLASVHLIAGPVSRSPARPYVLAFKLSSVREGKAQIGCQEYEAGVNTSTTWEYSLEKREDRWAVIREQLVMISN